MTRSLPTKIAAAFAAAGLALVAAACGDDGSGGGGSLASEDGTRTVNVEMRDNEFSPDQVDVEAGETVRFVFRNQGAVVHDAFVGDEAAQDDHEMEMREADPGDMADGADMGHGDGGEDAEGGLTVDPGETGELTHTFRAGDEVLIGCHQEGHYAAGMTMAINIS